MLGLLFALVAAAAVQPPDAPFCQTDIVSATVVSTYCGHPEGKNQVVDLVILWRGKPGWFQGTSGQGSGGSRKFAGGLRGEISSWTKYGDVTISFVADFNRYLATIGTFQVDLRQTNLVLIDHVEEEWKRVDTRIEPRLPLAGDWNLALARQSREVRDFLQCDQRMPLAAGYRVPVITVCERLE